MSDQNVRLAIVFLDIVGYSKRPDRLQLSMVQILQQAVRQSSLFRSAQPNGPPWHEVVILPTGDGMAVCCYCECVFEHPLLLVDFAVSILEFCEGNGFQLRIGIHVGDGQLYKDINGSTNIAGTAINRAQRIMNLGESGQVLVSESFREVVAAKLGERKAGQLFAEQGSAVVKHGLLLAIYSYAPPSARVEWTKETRQIREQGLIQSRLIWQLKTIERKLRELFGAKFRLTDDKLALRVSLLHRAPNPNNELEEGLAVSAIRYSNPKHALNYPPPQLWFGENEGPGVVLNVGRELRGKPSAMAVANLPVVDRHIDGEKMKRKVDQYYKRLEAACGTPRSKSERLHRLAASFIYVPFGFGRAGQKWEGVIAIDSKHPLPRLAAKKGGPELLKKVAEEIAREWETVGYLWRLLAQ